MQGLKTYNQADVDDVLGGTAEPMVADRPLDRAAANDVLRREVTASIRFSRPPGSDL